MNYDVNVMTNSDDETIMFQFTDWFPEESEEPEEDYAKGGKLEKAYEVILQLPNGKMNKRAILLAKTKDDASKKALNLKEFKQYGYVVVSANEIKYASGGKVKEKVFIEYLNKDKGFKMDRKYFNSYQEAERWARNNFDKFNTDYIRYEYAKGGQVLDLKDVYNELRSKVGRLEINEESKDYIYCDIRDWGNWEHDYEDYERDEEDFEDDDSMILSESSAKKMQSIVEEIRTKYPTSSIRWNTSEKNYIDFKISRKQSMDKGGYVNQYFGKGYENDAIIELQKALPNHKFEKGKNRIIVDNGKFIILTDKGRYGYIETYGNEGFEAGVGVEKLDDAIEVIQGRNMYADGGKVKQWKGNLYVKQTSVDYFGDNEGTSKSPTKRWFRINRSPMTQERLDEMAKPYIEKFGKQNVRTKNFEYMAEGGELEDDTFVMLFKGYGFVEKRGKYGTKTFYNRQHNATIYYDPKYRSISGYVGGGEGNDEVIPYSVNGVLDFFIEHDITESDATPFKKGGTLTYGRGGMDVGRWYRDKSGEEFKYIGEDVKGQSLFNDGKKVMYKPLEDFEGVPEEKKLFKFFRMGGALKEDFLEDVAEMHDDIKEITLKDGSKITHDELMEAHQFLEPDETQEYYASMQYGKGGTFDSKVEAISKKLVGKPVPKQYRKEYGSRYDKQDADEAARRIVGNMRKLYGE
jgi:hypothetical protein